MCFDLSSESRRAARGLWIRSHSARIAHREIRLGLLLGTIPQSRLEQLAHLVRAQREQLNDPKLTAVLDEIELRAAVELAKLTRSGG